MIFLFSVFIINQLSQLINFKNYFTYSYLDDLLCIPICCYIIQAIHKKVRDKYFILPISHIVISVLFFSIFFEFIFPIITTNQTSDMLDILCYCIGGYIFYNINKLENIEII